MSTTEANNPMAASPAETSPAETSPAENSPTTAQRNDAAVRQTVLLKRAVDQRLNTIVQRAVQLIDSSGAADSNSKLERSQWDNLLAVATETSSVEVVQNFVRYQIGRRDGDGWRHGGLGLGLVNEVDGWLREQAEAIATTTAAAGHPVSADQAWIMLLRLYLGYMRRYWFFARWQKNPKERGTHDN